MKRLKSSYGETGKGPLFLAIVWGFAQLPLGFISAALSILWILHIFLYMATFPPVSPFLNTMFIGMLSPILISFLNSCFFFSLSLSLSFGWCFRIVWNCHVCCICFVFIVLCVQRNVQIRFENSIHFCNSPNACWRDNDELIHV